jgi:hypothetical protein
LSWLLLGLLLGVIGAGWYGFERQSAVYEQLLRVLENDRDAARNEAKVFRGLLFPVLNKVEAVSEDAAKRSSQPSGEGRNSGSVASSQTASVSPRRRPRFIPSRVWFNMLRKNTNTPQKKTDALASALDKQVPKSVSAQTSSPQEKNYVAS